MDVDDAFERKFRWLVQRIPLKQQAFREEVEVRVEDFGPFLAFFKQHSHDMFSGMEACKKILNDRWAGQDFMCFKYDWDQHGAFQFEFGSDRIFICMKSRSIPNDFGHQLHHVAIVVISGRDAVHCLCTIA